MEFILMLDNAILDFFQLFRCAFLDMVMPLYSALGNSGIIFIVLGIILICFRKTRRTGAVMLLALLLCFLMGNVTLKPLFARVRPYEANGFTGLLVKPLTDFSFPSGHSFSAFSAAVSILFYNKKTGIFMVCAAFLMGFSRLYLYVHFPTDVIAGAVLGVLCAYIARWIVNKIKPIEKPNLQD